MFQQRNVHYRRILSLLLNPCFNRKGERCCCCWLTLSFGASLAIDDDECSTSSSGILRSGMDAARVFVVDSIEFSSCKLLSIVVEGAFSFRYVRSRSHYNIYIYMQGQEPLIHPHSSTTTTTTRSESIAPPHSKDTSNIHS